VAKCGVLEPSLVVVGNSCVLYNRDCVVWFDCIML